jgi:hypothetical protein
MSLTHRSLVPVAIALGALSFTAQAQKPGSKHGAYVGTATIAYSEPNKYLGGSYKATVKIAIPMTEAARAEIDDVDKPSAMATITELNTWGEAKAPDSGGRIGKWSCKLAAPVDVPMNAQGSLELDSRKKTYAMFIALVSTKEIPLTCTHNHSGAHKKMSGVGLFLATYDLYGGGPRTELPYADSARLAGKISLTGPALKEKYSPIVQEWDLKLLK